MRSRFLFAVGMMFLQSGCSALGGEDESGAMTASQIADIQRAQSDEFRRQREELAAHDREEAAMAARVRSERTGAWDETYYPDRKTLIGCYTQFSVEKLIGFVWWKYRSVDLAVLLQHGEKAAVLSALADEGCAPVEGDGWTPICGMPNEVRMTRQSGNYTSNMTFRRSDFHTAKGLKPPVGHFDRCLL